MKRGERGARKERIEDEKRGEGGREVQRDERKMCVLTRKEHTHLL